MYFATSYLLSQEFYLNAGVCQTTHFRFGLKQHGVIAGVSIKIEVASRRAGLNRVTDCIRTVACRQALHSGNIVKSKRARTRASAFSRGLLRSPNRRACSQAISTGPVIFFFYGGLGTWFPTKFRIFKALNCDFQRAGH